MARFVLDGSVVIQVTQTFVILGLVRGYHRNTNGEQELTGHGQSLKLFRVQTLEKIGANIGPQLVKATSDFSQMAKSFRAQ